MHDARTGTLSGLVLLAGLLVACSTGPMQPSGGEGSSKAFQTQQEEQPSFPTVSPDEYRAAREAACSSYCLRLYPPPSVSPGAQRENRYTRYLRYQCEQKCLTARRPPV